MDYLILRWFNGFAGQYIWLDILGIVMAEFLILSLPLIIFLVYFLSKRRKNLLPVIFKVIFSLALVCALNYLISLIFVRQRPFVDNKEIYQLAKFFNTTTDYSFPSCHTAIAFAMAFVVLLDWRKFGIILLISALIVGMGRVFVGIHYPTDILGGILTALISVCLINFIYKYFEYGNS